MNTIDISVALLPALLDPESLKGRTVVVADILRATTTITAALCNGATRVIPCPSIESAREAHSEAGPESILGGERGGQKVDGFHLGNSPLEYTPETIAGKTLILATTNGTVAMERCRAADQILIGAFANIGALADQLSQAKKISILCSGTDQKITSEDVLFAGALGDVICNQAVHSKLNVSLDDSTRLAISLWLETTRRVAAGDGSLHDHVAQSLGGRNLSRIGYHADIEFCSTLDTFDRVGRLNVASWEIT